jgi:hypothetical protein
MTNRGPLVSIVALLGEPFVTILTAEGSQGQQAVANGL